MKRTSIKIIAIILVMGSLMILGGSKIVDTYNKYKLATIAVLQGATNVEVTNDSVMFEQGNELITCYDFDYGIKQLSGE